MSVEVIERAKSGFLGFGGNPAKVRVSYEVEDGSPKPMMEDLLEEIVGDIRDEYDHDEEDPIRRIQENEYQVLGSSKLDDLNEKLGIHLESEDYDSIGGYIIEHLDHLPKAGEFIVTEDGIRLVVDTVTRKRIDRVHIYLPPKKEEDETEENYL